MHKNTFERSGAVVVRFAFQMSTSQKVRCVQSKFAYSLLYSLVVTSQRFETQFLENGSHCVTALDSVLELFVCVTTMIHSRVQYARNLARYCHRISAEGSPTLTEFTQKVSRSGAQFKSVAAA